MEANQAIANLIQTATAAESPDESLYRALSEMILSRADLPKEASRCFSKRLNTKNSKILLLSLDLIQYCSYACGLQFHNQIATKEFLMLLGSHFSSKDVDDQVKKKMLCLFKCWSNLLKKDLHPLYFQFEENLKNKGVSLPNNYNSRYAGVTANKPQNQKPNNFQGPSSHNVPISGGSSKNSKKMKFLQDIQQKIVFINEIFDKTDPRENIQSNEIVMQYMTMFKNNEESLRNDIASASGGDDDELMMFLINLNDDILKTKERFDQLRSHRRPPPFRGQEVEQEVLKQIKQLEQQTNRKDDQSVFKNFEDFGFKDNNTNQNNSWGAPSQAPPPPAPPKPAPQVENLIDLLDDPAPVQPPPQQPKPNNSFPIDLLGGGSSNPAPPTNNSTNLFNINNSNFTTGAPTNAPNNNFPPSNNNNFPPSNNNNFPPTNNNNFPPNNNNNFPPPNLLNSGTNFTNNSSVSPPTGSNNPQMNTAPPQPQLDKYAILDQLSNPNPYMMGGGGMNPMMGGGVNPMMGGGMNPMMGGGMNPMMGGGMNPMMGGGMNPMMGGGMNPNMNNGYGLQPNPIPNPMMSGVGGYNQPNPMMGNNMGMSMGMGGNPNFNQPSNSNTFNQSVKQPPVTNSGGAPFQEFDNMFGLQKGGNTNTNLGNSNINNNYNNNNNNKNNGQNKPPQNSQAFDDLI